MYEVFDLNRRKVCNIDPETGLVSYMYNGDIVIATLPIGKDLMLKRDGLVTRVLRDSSKTFTVELGTEDNAFQGTIRRRFDSSGSETTRVSLFGEGPKNKNVHSLDLVMKNGQYFIETKGARSPKIIASAELIRKAMEQISAITS